MLLACRTPFFSPNSTQQSRVAIGYAQGVPVSNYDVGWNRPAGGLYSTLNDMLSMLLTLNKVNADDYLYGPGFGYGNPSIMSDETLRELLLPAFMNPDTKSGQGSAFQIFYFMNYVVRTLTSQISGYSSHLITIPDLKLSMVVLSNADSVDMSEFVVPAMQTLIPLILDQLIVDAPLPTPPPNATLFAGTSYSGVDSTGEPGELNVTANIQGALMVTDSRLPSGVAYQLSYLNTTTPETARFLVQVVSTNVIGAPLLTCLNIVETGAQNDIMEFSNPIYGVGYNSLLFQGEQYRQLDYIIPV